MATDESFSVLCASDRSTLGRFDNYDAACALHKQLSRQRAVNLIQNADCGCSYRAIIKNGKHTGWRRVVQSKGCHDFNVVLSVMSR